LLSPIPFLQNLIRLINFFDAQRPLVLLIALNQIIQTNILITQTVITALIKCEIRIQIIWTSSLQKYYSILLKWRFLNLLPTLHLILIFFNLKLLSFYISLICTHSKLIIVSIARTGFWIHATIQTVTFTFPLFAQKIVFYKFIINQVLFDVAPLFTKKLCYIRWFLIILIGPVQIIYFLWLHSAKVIKLIVFQLIIIFLMNCEIL
jgi:hypothetical protein